MTAEPPKGGPGTDMLNTMKKAGKPVTPQIERMAAALDGMGVDDGQVGFRVWGLWGLRLPVLGLVLRLAERGQG